MRVIKIFFLLMITVLLGVGCISSHQQEENERQELSTEKETQKSKNNKVPIQPEKAILPFELMESHFHSVVDWKDDETIFYITNSVNGSKIHTYNFITGESSVFFEADSPIVQFEGNVDQTLFLVHTSPSTYEAELFILNDKAKLEYKTKIESYELEYSWNQMNGSQLFLSSFNEEWSFKTYILDVNKKKVIENPFDIPFIQWVSESEVSYLKWEQDVPTLTAPFYVYNSETETETLLSNSVISNTNFPFVMSTIELVDEMGTAFVRFYSYEDRTLLTEMPTRLVSLYSDWSIPFHDMDNNHLFYMIEANEDKSSFSLVSFDYRTKEKDLILPDIDNLPLRISPSGKYAIYGARFEYIIDLDKRTMNNLVKLK